MNAQNATFSTGTEPWYKLFDALQYVTNQYALLAYIFLATIVAISFSNIPVRLRGLTLAGLSLAIVATIGLLLSQSLHRVAEQSLIHLVNYPGRQSAEVAKRVRIQLIDTTSLEGKAKQGIARSGWRFNRELPPYVLEKVMELANAPKLSSQQLNTMTQEDWDKYLAELGPLKSDQVKDISFAKLGIFVDDRPVENLSDRWWFKGDVGKIDVDRDGSIRFKVANIYNTKNVTSFEPEAINLQLL